MRKLLLFLGLFVLVASYGFGQATPSGQLRVADTSTHFGQNIPIGTTLFCVTDSTFFVSTAPVASTYTLYTSYYKLLGAGTEKWMKIIDGKNVCDTCPVPTNAPYAIGEFEEPTTHAHGKNHDLLGQPYPQGFTVSLNGMELRTTEYELTWDPGHGQPIDPVAVFHINIPVYEYDRVKVWYFFKEKDPIITPD